MLGSSESSFTPHPRLIIPWGSDDLAFSTGHGNPPFNTVQDLHAAIANRSGIAGAPDPALPTRPVIVRPPQLRRYQLAYNTVNGFIYCENPGKVGGRCCSALPINQIFKHLTQKAVSESSDCVVHGYAIKPAGKEALEAACKEACPDAPFTPAELQNIVPLPGQAGPIVGIAPPVPGWICKACGRGYTTKAAAQAHWKVKHKDVPKPVGGSVIVNFFFQVPQMQSLSLHKNFIRYFAITPGDARADHAPLLATSDDMMLLSTIQEAAFGPEDHVIELDLDAVQAFFRNSGAVDHVKGLLPTELLRLVELPGKHEPKLVKLRRAQCLRFEAHSKRVFRGNAALRRLLVITKPYVTYVRLTWGNAYTLFPTNLAVNRQTKSSRHQRRKRLE